MLGNYLGSQATKLIWATKLASSLTKNAKYQKNTSHRLKTRSQRQKMQVINKRPKKKKKIQMIERIMQVIEKI